jgi:hypothetical protein
MLSTTTHLTTDIVAIPLLWVLPLGLYLLSFVVAFAAGAGWPTSSPCCAPVIILIAGGLAFTNGTRDPVFSGDFGPAAAVRGGGRAAHQMFRLRPAVGPPHALLSGDVRSAACWADCSAPSWRRWCSTGLMSTRC